MLPVLRNAVASSSRLPTVSILLQTRSNHYDASGRLAGLSQRPELPTTLFLAKVPNFYGEEQIRSRYTRHGIHIKDIYIPIPKNEEGKQRKRSRRFAFMEVVTEEDMRKATMISPEKIGFVAVPSRQTLEEARSYAEWAFDPAVVKAKKEANKPATLLNDFMEESRRKDRQTKWD